jgi:hypothetical protein
MQTAIKVIGTLIKWVVILAIIFFVGKFALGLVLGLITGLVAFVSGLISWVMQFVVFILIGIGILVGILCSDDSKDGKLVPFLGAALFIHLLRK